MCFLPLDLPDEPGSQMTLTGNQVQTGRVCVKHDVLEAFRMVMNMVEHGLNMFEDEKLLHLENEPLQLFVG